MEGICEERLLGSGVFCGRGLREEILHRERDRSRAHEGFTVFFDKNTAQPSLEFDLGKSNSIPQAVPFSISISNAHSTPVKHPSAKKLAPRRYLPKSWGPKTGI